MSERPVAIVTAAGKGIGGGIARLLAERGYRVSLLARSSAIEDFARELGGIATVGSVEEAADLERLVRTTMAHYGRIDALVNNTGHPAKGDPLALSDEQWQQGFNLILQSVFRMARLVAPIMIEQGSGSIVSVSSYAAVTPDPARPVSSVFRAGLSSWTSILATRLAPHGIRVNSVVPGFIETGHPAPATPPTIPLGRFGSPRELAQVVAFLLSPEAAYITGQNIVVDGGMMSKL
jgi:NAD(P)-dependent dehydrogenase (short-subunit alcohol dehydrogenase family)